MTTDTIVALEPLLVGASPSAYLLDTESMTARKSSSDDRRVPAGFGERSRVGVWRKDSVFVALFVRNGGLFVAVRDKLFRWDPGVSFSRRTLFGRIKQFRVLRQGTVEFEQKYIFIDSSHEWPGPELVDIFKFIAMRAGSDEDARRFIAWQDSGGHTALSER